jgi:hypothetical protein
MKRFDNLSPGVGRPTDRWPSGSGFIIKQKAQAQNSSPEPFEKTGGTIADADPAKTDNRESSPIPHGYRDWRLISVAHEEGDLNELRAEGRLA